MLLFSFPFVIPTSRTFINIPNDPSLENAILKGWNRIMKCLTQEDVPKRDAIEEEKKKLEELKEEITLLNEKQKQIIRNIFKSEQTESMQEKDSKQIAEHEVSLSIGESIDFASERYDHIKQDNDTQKTGGWIKQNFRTAIEASRRLLLKVKNSKLYEQPEIVLRSTKPEMGECYPFNGTSGTISIRLRNPEPVRAVSIKHIPQSPHYERSSAPNQFSATCICRSKVNESSKCLNESIMQLNQTSAEKAVLSHKLNDFEIEYYEHITNGNYVLNDKSSQLFMKENGKDTLLNCEIVRFNFSSNHGNPNYTCVYRLNVYHSPSNI
ncbi:SUN domain containing protein [Monocercomonoides exilis]|uniref:SUN domain containing protein n=1 Tax=Monocercomonoides exilis TaxID=2049356 RepID=UPI00355A7AA9|nr:SUN domain containing protein [Monocercomonoides exilis]|eukprot:MONOS_5384.1-p1 / transcript=MONOS_5384.1 / gene=MONOS_5384 / organism=Monocercomonoides_exilis_PA203 / gene_product=SUN domain containing protein / transcript_product=SUN domain containing protein / location=Mono_scaffold00156:1667-2638(+) / protein_length=323 / sequence_SO=supercontig / SO=protein_coding / is_pseudo=false